MEISAFAFTLFDLVKEQATSNQKVAYFHLQSADMDAAIVTIHSNYPSRFMSFYFVAPPKMCFIYILSDVSMNKMS